MKEYLYIIKVQAENINNANQVILNRINYDEDYGFEYSIDAAKRETEIKEK